MLAVLSACAEGPGAGPAATTAPAVAPVSPTAVVYASCEAACAQHCSSTSDRPTCEAAQVRCGCAPGMRRPPHTIPPTPPTTTTTPPTTTEPTPAASPVPDCFGPSLPLRVHHGTPYVDVRIGEASGAFLVDYGTTFSTLDPSAFTPAPVRSGACWPTGDLFGPWPCPTLSVGGAGPSGMPFRQAGILGTDVLASHAHVLDLASARLHRGASCSPDALGRAGFASLEVLGWGSARRPAGVLVPAVVVDVGGARAPAQLDTGFADGRVHRSINVNQAFFDAAVAAGAPLVRWPDGDLSLTTCAGVPEPVEAYRLDGELGWVGIDGAIARRFDGVTVFLKRTPEAARRCGGIGTWSEPGAQLGASFLEGRRVVLDPAGAVWID